MNSTRLLSLLALVAITVTGCFLYPQYRTKKQPRMHPRANTATLQAASQNVHKALPMMCGKYTRHQNKTTRNLLSKVFLPQLTSRIYNGKSPAVSNKEVQAFKNNRKLLCENSDFETMSKNDRRATNSLLLPLKELAPDASSYLLTFFWINQECWEESDKIRDNDGRVVATRSHKTICGDGQTVGVTSAWIDQAGSLLWWGKSLCGKPYTNSLMKHEAVTCGENDQGVVKSIDKLYSELPLLSASAPQPNAGAE